MATNKTLSYYKSRYKKAKRWKTHRRIMIQAEANLSTTMFDKFLLWYMEHIRNKILA